MSKNEETTLVWRRESMLSSVTGLKSNETPALLTKMSILVSVSWISLASFRTEVNDFRSKYFTTMLLFEVSCIKHLLNLFEGVLQATITRQPLLDRHLDTSKPIPEKNLINCISNYLNSRRIKFRLMACTRNKFIMGIINYPQWTAII